MASTLIPRLPPELRVTLNAIRAIAACYVVMHHLVVRGNVGPIEPIFRFGQEAVMAFFMLSGFVIHANERDRAASGWITYLARRAMRIYPTLLVAMLISALVALTDGTLLERFRVSDALCTLAGLQDAGSLKPGTICSPFLGNSPLWSLSYEILFYLLYPLILPVFLQAPSITNHLIGGSTVALTLLYSIFPNHFILLASYYIIWWAGAMMCERCLNPDAPPWLLRDTLVWLFIAVLTWGLVGFVHGVALVGTYPMLMIRHFGSSLILIALALSPIGNRLISLFSRHGAAGWQWAADVSYGIYVFHFPLLIQWSLAKSWAGLAAAALIMLIAADVADRRLSRLCRRLLRKATAKKST